MQPCETITLRRSLFLRGRWFVAGTSFTGQVRMILRKPCAVVRLDGADVILPDGSWRGVADPVRWVKRGELTQQEFDFLPCQNPLAGRS